MMKLRCFAVALVLLCTTACNSLSQLEQQRYKNLIAQGATPQRIHSPMLAGFLNVAPGIGDIHNGEWGAFVLDLLLWPYSVPWAVPQAIVTANNYNKKATIIYYTSGEGKGKYNANAVGSKSNKAR